MLALLLVALAWSAPQVEVREITHASEVRGKDVSYVAWIPQSEAPLPALYLLHGAWGSHEDWREHAQDELSQLAAEHQVVILTPDGEEFGWWADGNQYRIESYVVQELIPHVEATLPVRTDRRAIAGLSMGGQGALGLALRHPGLFVSASSMSGILDITQHPRQWSLHRVFGSYHEHREVWRAHSVAWLLRMTSEHPPMLLTVSSDDPWAVHENRALHHELVGRGVEHGWREDPGTHDWAYWTAVVPHHVSFHAEHLYAP